MKVEQIGSNQTVVTKNNGMKILFSYQTPVAGYIPGKGYFRTDKKWSVTTTKHINKYLTCAECVVLPQSEIDKMMD